MGAGWASSAPGEADLQWASHFVLPRRLPTRFKYAMVLRGAEGLSELGRYLRMRWVRFVSSLLLLLWLLALGVWNSEVWAWLTMAMIR